MPSGTYCNESRTRQPPARARHAVHNALQGSTIASTSTFPCPADVPLIRVLDARQQPRALVRHQGQRQDHVATSQAIEPAYADLEPPELGREQSQDFRRALGFICTTSPMRRDASRRFRVSFPCRHPCLRQPQDANKEHSEFEATHVRILFLHEIISTVMPCAASLICVSGAKARYPGL